MASDRDDRFDAFMDACIGTLMTDNFTKALHGDERAQMRHMIQSLAFDLRITAGFIKHAEAREAMKAAATAALEYILPLEHGATPVAQDHPWTELWHECFTCPTCKCNEVYLKYCPGCGAELDWQGVEVEEGGE